MNFTNLETFMHDMLDGHSPGNSCQVYLKGKKVFEHSCGYADAEEKRPMTGEELFFIYSCSKVATATAGVQLLEKGRFLLTDPLYEYMPEFRYMYVKGRDGDIRPAERYITIKDLFTMTAGFNYNLESPAIKRAQKSTGGRMGTLDVIRELAKEPLDYEPGTQWQYSLGHDVLAAFIETISGERFCDYVKHHIFEPLEMNDSCYHLPEESKCRMAQQYRFVPDKENNIPDDLIDGQFLDCFDDGGRFDVEGIRNRFTFRPDYDSGGAGIITSCGDYAKLCAALGNSGVGANGERILSPAAIRLMTTNQLNEEQMKYLSWSVLRGYGYGLGVRTHIDPSKSGCMSPVGEFGWGGAAGATVVCDTETGVGCFFVQHTLNPREPYYQPRLKNALYSCL